MLLQKTCHDGLLTRCRASADMSFFGKKASARDVRHPGQGSSRYLMKMAHILIGPVGREISAEYRGI